MPALRTPAAQRHPAVGSARRGLRAGSGPGRPDRVGSDVAPRQLGRDGVRRQRPGPLSLLSLQQRASDAPRPLLHVPLLSHRCRRSALLRRLTPGSHSRLSGATPSDKQVATPSGRNVVTSSAAQMRNNQSYVLMRRFGIHGNYYETTKTTNIRINCSSHQIQLILF